MHFTVEELENLTFSIPESFVSFAPRGIVETHQRNLPHWKQEGASYAVTFRTADSVPQNIAASIHEESSHWKKLLKDSAQPSNGLKRSYRHFQRRTQNIVNGTLDECHGSCPFGELAARQVVQDSLFHFNGDRYELFGAAIMPNHVHVIVRPEPLHSLSSILKSWKGFTSRALKDCPKPLWMHESYDRIIRDEQHYVSALKYLLSNPARAKLSADEAFTWGIGVSKP